jgi:hypothetical protein
MKFLVVLKDAQKPLGILHNGFLKWGAFEDPRWGQHDTALWAAARGREVQLFPIAGEYAESSVEQCVPSNWRRTSFRPASGEGFPTFGWGWTEAL